MTEVATERATGQATLQFNNSTFIGFKNTVTIMHRYATCKHCNQTQNYIQDFYCETEFKKSSHIGCKPLSVSTVI